MYITLTDTFDSTVEKAITTAKKHNIDVYFDRDGERGMKDIDVILKFKQAGFSFDITTYKGRFEENAIRVIFQYISKNRNA